MISLYFKTIRLLFFSVCIILIHSIPKSVSAQGIQFKAGSFEQILAQAKSQNKAVFVEIYLNGCPHCEALAPVLTEKKVGDFYNSAFVSLKAEANSALAKSLQDKQKLYFPEFPLFFFFDASGKLLHQATPSDKPTRPEFIEEVLRHGTNALNPAVRTSSYPARFAQGERTPDFLINYGKYTKATRDTARLMEISNELARLFVQPADLESQVGFYILGRIIPDFQNPMAQYFFTHLDTYRSRYGVREIQQAGEGILFQTLYGHRTNDLTSKEVIDMRKAMESLGVPAAVVAMRTILKEIETLLREKNTAQATARFDAYQSASTLGLPDYAYLVRFFNEKAPDSSYAESLVRWVNRALTQVKPGQPARAEVAELYREQSEAYLRLGKKAEGKKAAETALALAKATKEALPSYEKQVAKFR
ncbi:thioredoxin family protein [Arundinibacter roseus]|uniref:Thioredoxin family protein n=1 Tax=Arundinibacter roseus TaxID=2070510 RepID=A0A4R4KI83_9BACT|nr:thioredoxin family protein [Arundinibacter roseus]TDB67844.1 thioredoxin family protein [Arundinibacter roseus]